MDQPENQTPDRNFFGGFTSTLLLIWDFVKIVLVALVIIIPIRYFVFQPFIVQGASMEPNYYNGQYLIVDELSYRFGDPKRGDVVVMRSPKNENEYYIKRIIALPKEKVQIKNGVVTVYNAEEPQGVILNEPYLPNQGLTYEQDPIVVGGNKLITLASDEYFVLGDNRSASSDSREWGALHRKDIIGKSFIRVLPLTEFKIFTKTPAYNL